MSRFDVGYMRYIELVLHQRWVLTNTVPGDEGAKREQKDKHEKTYRAISNRPPYRRRLWFSGTLGCAWGALEPALDTQRLM